MAFEWYEPPTAVFVPMTVQYVQGLHAGIVAIAERRAPEITAWMKANHPWQNQTGAAEEGLQTAVEDVVGSMVEIILAHGADIDYGIWLETKFSGRDAIIAPAVDYWGVLIWRDVQNLVRA